MNIALIIAGGSGTRMNTRTMPKQFLELHGKAIIIHTLEQFENHPEVDAIVVVCIESHVDYLNKLLKKHSIQKVAAVIPGAGTRQDSIYQGLTKTHELFPDDSVVLIHDGVRPLIDHKTISDDIACVRENGNAITTAPAQETIVLCEEGSSKISKVPNRNHCAVAKSPQCFWLKDIWSAYETARAEDRHDFTDSASLMRHYGHDLYTVPGPFSNIKITTPADYYIFRALVDAREAEQIMGL